MARNDYAEIKLHVTWHIKESAPVLEPKVEAIVYHYLPGKCINTPGVYIHKIGGIDTCALMFERAADDRDQRVTFVSRQWPLLRKSQEIVDCPSFPTLHVEMLAPECVSHSLRASI